MNEQFCFEAEPPYWIESCDIRDGSQYGTYVIDGNPAAAYSKHPYSGKVSAYLFTIDEVDMPQILIEVEGPQEPFATVETAKPQLEKIARLAFGF